MRKKEVAARKVKRNAGCESNFAKEGKNISPEIT